MAWETKHQLAIGGVVSVGFLDEHTLLVGSHSGLGVIDARSGTVTERIGDVAGEYPWSRDEPAAIAYTRGSEEVLVPSAGLWGGELPMRTSDGWEVSANSVGAVLKHGHEEVSVEDDGELRAFGFSPEGHAFVLATSPTVTVLSRG